MSSRYSNLKNKIQNWKLEIFNRDEGKENVGGPNLPLPNSDRNSKTTIARSNEAKILKHYTRNSISSGW